MVYKLGTVSDMRKLEKLPVPVAVRQMLTNDLTILDREYGADRSIDENDGGFLLYCTPNTGKAEIKDFFDAENHLLEWADCIDSSPPYCIALYLLSNEYAVEIIMPLNEAFDHIKEELSIGTA